jgi:predicted lactoylglutathione lyase
MSRSIFVNLAVTDVQASIAFFSKLGFEFNPAFTDEHATAMIVNDQATVMLLDRGRFADFLSEGKQIADSRTHSEALVSFSAGSRAEVDEIIANALASGGSPAKEVQDHGFMYGGSFQDLDGHHWEVMWMDASALGE